MVEFVVEKVDFVNGPIYFRFYKAAHHVFFVFQYGILIGIGVHILILLYPIARPKITVSINLDSKPFTKQFWSSYCKRGFYTICMMHYSQQAMMCIWIHKIHFVYPSTGFGDRMVV